MINSNYRGHKITYLNNKWVYKDTGESVSNNINRSCGYCKKENTAEGHDGCLGTLPNIMNACCGHGKPEFAYIQLNNGVCIRGATAMEKIKELRND